MVAILKTNALQTGRNILLIGRHQRSRRYAHSSSTPAKVEMKAAGVLAGRSMPVQACSLVPSFQLVTFAPQVMYRACRTKC